MTAMNLVLFAQRRLFAVVRRIADLLAAPQPLRVSVHIPAHIPVGRFPGARPAALAMAPAVRRAPVCPQTARPLRVLRVMEPGQQRTAVGRMVISGSMADVCAELDRLAAREAAMS